MQNRLFYQLGSFSWRPARLTIPGKDRARLVGHTQPAGHTRAVYLSNPIIRPVCYMLQGKSCSGITFTCNSKCNVAYSVHQTKLLVKLQNLLRLNCQKICPHVGWTYFCSLNYVDFKRLKNGVKSWKFFLPSAFCLSNHTLRILVFLLRMSKPNHVFPCH